MQEQPTAIYPGTFDPFTLGHLDIVERAAPLFGRVIVAISQNPSKTPLFTVAERVAMAQEAVSELSGVAVETFDGLLVAYAERAGAAVIVKGIRGGEDAAYEEQMAQMNRDMTGIETVYLSASPAYRAVSSTLVKEIARFGGTIDRFVPSGVARMMKERFRDGS
ncbi:MAG TPA: pantetheine-phosphate adenylyltransferase [Actinomycetota bacterium]